jgi:hypothetical protein
VAGEETCFKAYVGQSKEINARYRRHLLESERDELDTLLENIIRGSFEGDRRELILFPSASLIPAMNKRGAISWSSSSPSGLKICKLLSYGNTFLKTRPSYANRTAALTWITLLTRYFTTTLENLTKRLLPPRFTIQTTSSSVTRENGGSKPLVKRKAERPLAWVQESFSQLRSLPFYANLSKSLSTVKDQYHAVRFWQPGDPSRVWVYCNTCKDLKSVRLGKYLGKE